jgi:hypothetical protein
LALLQFDWKEGSAITYEGEYQGKAYKDKGLIEKLEPEKIFQSTYWSSMSGKEDKSENYNIVTYTLSWKDGRTLLHFLRITFNRKRKNSM